MLYISITNVLLHEGAYAQLKKTWAKTFSQRQDCIIEILRKCVIEQAFGGLETKTGILAILNKYKNILENLIISLNIESLMKPKPVGRRLRNIMVDLDNYSIEPKLNKNPTNLSLRQQWHGRVAHIAGNSGEQKC